MLFLCYSRNGLQLGQQLKKFPLAFTRNAGRTRNPSRSPQFMDKSLGPGPPVPPKIILRSGLFTFVSVNTLLCGSAIWAFEHWRSRAHNLKHGQHPPGHFEQVFTEVRKKLESLIGRPLRERDLFWGVVVCNVLVYLLHHSPLQMMSLRYFANTPYSPTPALSMLLSVFSHYSLFHLAINMYVLHSFTPTLIHLVGPADFIYLLVGGGIFASFFSLINKAVRRSVIPSLGASGGICAVLGAFCMLQPHSRLCVPFVVDVFPHSFEAQSAVRVLLAMEFLASIFLSGRSPIDHAAHMGGLIFGMFYSFSGMEGIWKRRNAIVALWRKWRQE